MKETRHCENFFLLQYKNGLKVTLKVFLYEIVGNFHSFCQPLKRITSDFFKMEVSNYSLVTMMQGQISTAMSQLFLVLVLFARTLSLSRSFCFVSCIVVKILVDKVISKLHCSA